MKENHKSKQANHKWNDRFVWNELGIAIKKQNTYN